MSLAQNLRSARQAVEMVLDGMGMDSYLYTVEPYTAGSDREADRWSVRVECSTRGGWKEAHLNVDPGELRASLRDPSVRAKLQRDWQPHLR